MFHVNMFLFLFLFFVFFVLFFFFFENLPGASLMKMIKNIILIFFLDEIFLVKFTSYSNPSF